MHTENANNMVMLIIFVVNLGGFGITYRVHIRMAVMIFLEKFNLRRKTHHARGKCFSYKILKTVITLH